MTDIKNRIVYMLCRTDETDDDGTDIYIGSTSRPLKERLRKHRSNAKNFLKRGYTENRKLYTGMNEVGFQSWNIISLLTFTCDKKTVFEFEKRWIGLIGADLNTISPITNRKEYKVSYREANKEEIQQQHANYYKENKQVILQRDADYREFNVQNKVHHCNVCDKSFGYRKDLNRHYDTLAHSYAYMDSVD